MAEPFTFELVSPESLVLSTEATQVVVPGSEGYFAVMAKHTPVMTSLMPGVVEVTNKDGKTTMYFVRGGFADIAPTEFTLLAEEATNLEDFDMADLETHIQYAKEDVADSTGDKQVAAKEMLAKLEEAKVAVTQAMSGANH